LRRASDDNYFFNSAHVRPQGNLRVMLLIGATAPIGAQSRLIPASHEYPTGTNSCTRREQIEVDLGRRSGRYPDGGEGQPSFARGYGLNLPQAQAAMVRER
jgi:hypothetical protein